MRHGLHSGTGQAADSVPPDDGTGPITQAGEGASQPVQDKQENQGRNESPAAAPDNVSALAVTSLPVPTAADAKLAVPLPLHVATSAPTMPASAQPVSVALVVPS